jgi:hypothetical protein
MSMSVAVDVAVLCQWLRLCQWLLSYLRPQIPNGRLSIRRRIRI